MSPQPRRYPRVLTAVLLGLCWLSPRAGAQPTYKLEVGRGLKPLATLTLEGVKVSRSRVKDDPGFRLQYRFTRGGKEVAVIEARARTAVEVPRKEPGTFAVVLELFHPTYKPGKQQRGKFQPVSNTLVYRVEPAAKAGEPGKVVLVESIPLGGKRALVVQCGKGAGKQQDELLDKGFGYKLLQGQPLDGWPAGAGRGHRWQDPKEVRFELTLPPKTGGTLRLYLVDGENQKRRQRVVVGGKPRGDVEGFGGPGKTLEVSLTAAEVAGGRVEVSVRNLNPGGSAVVSTVEFVPAGLGP
jgi:hypothetical protein